MSKQETANRIEYIVCCVGAFADRFSLSDAQAYVYLRRFGAISFLMDCYGAEHTLPIDDAVEDMQAICQREGGRVA